MLAKKIEKKQKQKIVIEKALKSKFKTSRSVSNGHDCWGSSEYCHYDCIKIDNRTVDIYERDYIIHDEEKVLEIIDFNSLPENMKIQLDEKLWQKKEDKDKEDRYKKFLKLKKEFDEDQVYIRDQKILNIIE